MEAASEFAIRVLRTEESHALVKRLREIVAVPVATLASAIRDHDPVTIRRLYALDHDEAEAVVLALLRDLDAMGVAFEVLLSGAVVSRQYLSNVLQRYRDIRHDTEMEMDLEFGEPSEEPLRWARGEGKKSEEP